MEKINRLISRKPVTPEHEQRMQVLEEEFERLSDQDLLAIATEAAWCLALMSDEDLAALVNECD